MKRILIFLAAAILQLNAYPMDVPSPDSAQITAPTIKQRDYFYAALIGALSATACIASGRAVYTSPQLPPHQLVRGFMALLSGGATGTGAGMGAEAIITKIDGNALQKQDIRLDATVWAGGIAAIIATSLFLKNNSQ